MTPTPSTRRLDLIYSNIADAMERDPIQGGEGTNRATVPMGRGFALWQRMNPGSRLIELADIDGRSRWVTTVQYSVYMLALEMTGEHGRLTMRGMAETLNVSPSTISRALTKLAAFGLIAVVVGRGRWAGLVIRARMKDDGLERFRQAAKARVRGWSEAVQRRLSRSFFNVAPYVLEGGRGYDSLTSYVLDTNTYKSATLTAQPFSVEELRSVGII